MSAALRYAPVLLLCVLWSGAARAAAPPDRGRHVAELVRQLDDDRFTVRQRADRALRKLGRPVVPQLRLELEHTKSVEVRWRLTRIIYDLTVDERLPDLIRALGDSHADLREMADWELRRYGKAIVPLLRKELTAKLDKDRRVRLERIIAELSPLRRR
jgi:hypothetical protein